MESGGSDDGVSVRDERGGEWSGAGPQDTGTRGPGWGPGGWPQVTPRGQVSENP